MAAIVQQSSIVQRKGVVVNYEFDLSNINLNNINLVSFYIPGKSNMRMLYSADRHKDLLNFYEVDTDNIKFKYSNTYHNWVRKREDDDTKTNLKRFSPSFL